MYRFFVVTPFLSQRADTPTVAIVIPILGPELRHVHAKNKPPALSNLFFKRIRRLDRAQVKEQETQPLDN